MGALRTPKESLRWNWNPCQECAWLFVWMLYQLNYSHAPDFTTHCSCARVFSVDRVLCSPVVPLPQGSVDGMLLCSKAVEFSPFWHPSHLILPCLQNCMKNSPLQTVPQKYHNVWFQILPSFFPFPHPLSPWYNHNGWLGVKHQVTYLLTPTLPHHYISSVCTCGYDEWGIQYIYELFLRFYVSIFEHLVKRSCLPLLVRYGAVETTLLLLQLLPLLWTSQSKMWGSGIV